MKFGIKIAKNGVLRSSYEILAQKEVKMTKIREIWPNIPYFNKEIDEQIEINAHYRGYLRKQKADILPPSTVRTAPVVFFEVAK